MLQQHEWALNPVTALEFCHSADGRLLLLVGEGVYLKVFEAETSKLLSQCQIFEGQAIHGISAETEPQLSKGSRLIIWGGRSFSLLESEELESILSCKVTSTVSSAQVAPDWILDGAISPSFGVVSCIFITAHSVAIHAKIGEKEQQPQLESLSSPSQSILYSAHVVWTSVNKIMIAAGTVFGEIEVITWDLSAVKGTTGTLLFTFSGHEGSIFGVQISPEICQPDGSSTRLLASCSDDRTIRLWDLSLQPNSYSLKLSGSRSQTSVRETGFGENSDVSSQESAKRCVAVVMGHASRIWRVKFLIMKVPSGFQTTVNVLSFGEDSTCQQWSLDSWANPNTEMPEFLNSSGSVSLQKHHAALRHLNTFSYHTGKHLWAAALVSFQGGVSRLATGGADGKISIYDVFVNGFEDDSFLGLVGESANSSISTYSNTTLTYSWTSEDLLEEELSLDVTTRTLAPTDEIDTPSKKKKKPVKITKDALNRYCFVTKDQMLVTTSFGRIMLGSIKDQQTWQNLPLPGHENNDLKSYSIVLGLPAHQLALLAGAHGVIYLYHHGDPVMELCKIKGKVAALLDITPIGSNHIQIFVTTLGSEEGQILFLEPQSTLGPQFRNIVTVELPTNFVVTSAGDVCGQLVLGSRSGMLAVYEHLPRTQQYKLICHHTVQDKDAITAITPVVSSESTENPHFVITSRSGTYSIFSLSTTPPGEDLVSASLKLVHQATPPLGPMIESAWFDGSDLLLYGFRSKSFIVWNETKQLEITNVECGGAHRSYSYLPIPGAGGAGLFAYTKASKLYLHLQMKASHVVVKAGGHGREIKACAVASGKGNLIATGAEDTTIRIWRERESMSATNVGNLECVAVIQKHSAGIQHLEWSSLSDSNMYYLFSAGGNEEFYVWRMTSIPGFGLGVVCEASLTDYSLERDLRIMSLDVQTSTNEDSPGYKLSEAMNEASFTLSLAYSDSTIKRYNYSPQGGFMKILQGRYTSACLTQITTPINGSRLITAATDGHLAVWECLGAAMEGLGELQPISRVKIHQSAILSLDTYQLGPDSFIMATGGDDNALALTSITNWKVAKQILVPSAHAAAITGAGFMRMHAESKVLRLWTAGGDQRVKWWALYISSGDEDIKVSEVTMEDNVWSSIPDVGGLARLHKRELSHERCLVWGNGLEIVKLKEV